MRYIGIDLGGTNIKGGLVTPEGELIAERSRPTEAERGAEAVLDRIAAVIGELSAEAGGEAVGGVGLGCPGTVDDRSGSVLYANNLHWENLDLRAALRGRTGQTIRLINDANAAALGEAVAGCAKGADSAVVLTLGTGLGSGVVLRGRLWTGYTGAAAELGHAVIVDGGEPCTCGRRGCLEAYASATALIRMTKEAMASHPESRMREISGGIDGRTAFDAAALGDETARGVVENYIHYLALGVANIINCFYPEVVALSGGVSLQGPRLLEPLRRAVYPQVYGGVRERRTRIECAALGYRAGVIGAAMLCAREGDVYGES